MTERNFFGADGVQAEYAQARVVIVPAPLERSVCYGAGTRGGPQAILTASAQMETYDERERRPFDLDGIHTQAALEFSGTGEEAVARVEGVLRGIFADGKFGLTLGGEHTVAVGAVAAARRVWPDIGVLQIDAHADLRDRYLGDPYNHACTMRRIRDLGIPVVSCGVRSLSREEAVWLEEQGERVPLEGDRDLEGRWIDELVARLPGRVYLTFDIDGLDPAVAPGTGTPEPGGLTYREAERLITAVGRSRTLVGADLCEVAPISGQTVTEFTAARLVARMISSC